MKKLLFSSLIGCIMFASCSKEDNLSLDPNDSSNMEMSLQIPSVYDVFGEVGEIELADQAYIDNSARFPGMANSDFFTLYLLHEAATGEIIEVYDEDEEWDDEPGIEFQYKWKKVKGDSFTTVACPKSGKNCATATTTNGACALIKKNYIF
ncbi:MAG: hypothetical protein JJU02_13490 [Cryomorphaceae bacterium]|nr:hypothetical protein [Cryomorphaceae bacterium]